jgi:hypothetical protein
MMTDCGVMDAGSVARLRPAAVPRPALGGDVSVRAPSIDDLPGFRRRIRITPAPGNVVAAVEDDYHHMSIMLEHDGHVATGVRAEMVRVPWTTCPGAERVVERTFTGTALDGFVARGAKTANCTHLHDLAVLAAAHAGDECVTVYDILVSDPDDGRVLAELRRDGRVMLTWVLERGLMTEPASIRGLGLTDLGPWIATLDRAGQEQARLLRWGTILAHGRTKSMEGRSKATDLPIGQCYTFQPDMAALARYVPGTVFDFSEGLRQPLADSTSGSSQTGSQPCMKGVVASATRGETA